MNLSFDVNLASCYISPSQRIRVLTESWVNSQIFCPSCGNNINQYENNRPAADFYCKNCREEYELKSKKENIGLKIVNGAYKTMMERLQTLQNPNLFLLSYSLQSLEVLNFLVIPKQFFIPNIIEKRNPLSQNARRAGWQGCNILLQNIPQTGKIFFIKNKIPLAKEEILHNWGKVLFLSKEKDLKAKSWILDVMNCIDRLNKRVFSLDEIYGFEKELSFKHPNNRHIKDKIRQQLQFLRDRGYLKFISRGRYGPI